MTATDTLRAAILEVYHALDPEHLDTHWPDPIASNLGDLDEQADHLLKSILDLGPDGYAEALQRAWRNLLWARGRGLLNLQSSLLARLTLERNERDDIP